MKVDPISEIGNQFVGNLSRQTFPFCSFQFNFISDFTENCADTSSEHDTLCMRGKILRNFSYILSALLVLSFSPSLRSINSLNKHFKLNNALTYAIFFARSLVPFFICCALCVPLSLRAIKWRKLQTMTKTHNKCKNKCIRAFRISRKVSVCIPVEYTFPGPPHIVCCPILRVGKKQFRHVTKMHKRTRIRFNHFVITFLVSSHSFTTIQMNGARAGGSKNICHNFRWDIYYTRHVTVQTHPVQTEIISTFVCLRIILMTDRNLCQTLPTTAQCTHTFVSAIAN